ncbi:MFS transporter [Roseinatronobacter sp.]|uniref:MFS transporter n=1 Tax=Roseinatronobacter sp. TaxID=1945755 RepID=UPI0025DC3D99|nr:MFS transporter [Roseibaca sp.]
MTTPRKRIWGWWAFDWANQPYNTLLLTFIFAPYFASAVASDPVTGQALWGWMLAISGLLIAVAAPVMGAIADSSGNRRSWLLLWSALYALGAASLWFAVPNADPVTIALVLLAFAIGLVGLEFGIVFTNATLPDLGTREDLGQISGTGWALGYVGGLVSLVVMLLFLAENDQGVTLIGLSPLFGLDADAREGTRFVGPFTAIWYAIFVIPFFLWVPIKSASVRATGAVRRGLSELRDSLRALPGRRSLFAYLGASLLYRDALNGIYAFGGIYAAGVLGWSIVQIGVFGILAAAVGAVACWLAGKLDTRFGPKPVIIGCVVLLMAVCVIIVGTDRSMAVFLPVADGSSLPDITFYICGALIGAGGGSLQSASRTMMVRQADPARMTEGFGLYALSGKALAFLAPASVALVTTLTDSQRLGVTPLIVLFMAGLVLLILVDPEGEPEFRCAPS